MTILLENISRKYSNGTEVTYALNNINLNIKEGEMVAIMGPSGSGKSTLLNILGFIDKGTNGKYLLNNIDTQEIKGDKLARFRNTEIGFIFQYFALIKELNVIDNVILPLMYRKMSQKARINEGEKYLEKLGIIEHKNKKISELSGGQQQRVAIARALIGNPRIILADEPTGALDQKTGKDIMKILREINKEGKTVVVVTHDNAIADFCNRTIKLVDGMIVE